MMYVEWQDVKSDTQQELNHARNVLAYSMSSTLQHHEALLEVLGERLIELNALKQPDKSRKLVDDLLKKNNELAGFGLANTLGQLVTTSFNIDRRYLPNLLKSPKTASTFKEALNSKNMVMGQTYFMKALNAWIIPVRYRVTNKEGNVVAVMTTGFKVDTSKSAWSSENLPKNMDAIIIRKDMYPQYVSRIKKSDYAKIYHQPLKKETFDFLKHPESGINVTEKNTSPILTSLKSEGSILTSIGYNPIYNYHTIISIPVSALYPKLITPASWLAALLLLFNISLYFIFRATISSSIKDKRDMQAMMDHSPAVIYIKDLSGKFIFINEKFELLYDVKTINVIGKKPSEIFSEDIANDMSLHDEAVIKNGDSFESEDKVHHNDETYLYISTKFPLLDTNKNIYAIGVISSDVTQSKQHEKRLHNSQKMESLGKLTGGIAHDYNNMLGVILGYCDLLNEFIDNESDLINYVKEIEHAAQRGTKLTTKLLGFSRSKSADAVVLDLNMLLTDEQHMLEKTLTARIDLKFDLDKNLWPILIDSNDLEDAILNITINAMHAIEGNGELVIQTQNQSLQQFGADQLGLKVGDYTTLSITDTGCGMDEATKEKIFDPFYSTKGDEGTGLGLSQVYGFVKRSGGQIIVYSEPNHGAQFRFYFPRYEGSNNEETIEEITIDEDLTGSESILLVDDEPSLLMLMSEMLQQKGYQVLCAEDAETALKILEKNKIDLMMSDIVMPKMDGFQLATIVQKKYPSIIIQLVSGFSDEIKSDYVDEKLKNNLLAKPITQQILLERVRKLFKKN